MTTENNKKVAIVTENYLPTKENKNGQTTKVANTQLLYLVISALALPENRNNLSPNEAAVLITDTLVNLDEKSFPEYEEDEFEAAPPFAWPKSSSR